MQFLEILSNCITYILTVQAYKINKTSPAHITGLVWYINGLERLVQAAHLQG
jgi:hypothetical protein